MITQKHIASVVKNGNWMIRRTNNGKSLDVEFCEIDRAGRARVLLHNQLPDGLWFNRSLDLSYTNLTQLPAYLLVVNGFLAIKKTNVSELPNDLVIDRNIDLNLIDESELSASMVVNGYLDISYTKIKNMPTRVVVKGFFDVRGTKITTVPSGAIIKGKIYPKKLRKKEIK